MITSINKYSELIKENYLSIDIIILNRFILVKRGQTIILSYVIPDSQMKGYLIPPHVTKKTTIFILHNLISYQNCEKLSHYILSYKVGHSFIALYCMKLQNWVENMCHNNMMQIFILKIEKQSNVYVIYKICNSP